jgi:hypothetical protein
LAPVVEEPSVAQFVQPAKRGSASGGKPLIPAKSAEDSQGDLAWHDRKEWNKEKQAQTQTQQSLKGALADVLKKNEQKSPEKPSQPATGRNQQTTNISPTEAKRPFEVSEDMLKKVLKGDA